MRRQNSEIIRLPKTINYYIIMQSMKEFGTQDDYRRDNFNEKNCAGHKEW